MDTLPHDVLVIVVEKAVEDPDRATTLQSLRLVNKRFHAAVEQAAFALRPSSGLTAEHLRKVGSLFPGVRQLNLSGCGHLEPDSLMDLLREIGSPAFCPRTRETDVSGCSQLRLSPQALFGVQPNLTGLHTLASWLEGSAAAQLVLTMYRCSYLGNIFLMDVGSHPIPEGISGLVSLASLEILHCGSLRVLPDSLSLLTTLTSLAITGSHILSLAAGLSALIGLRTLNLDNSRNLRSLPAGLSALIALRMLTLNCCFGLRSLPQGLSALVALRTLSLDGCKGLRSIPAELSAVPELRVLSIKGCISLRWLPCRIKKMPHLTIVVTELTPRERVHSFVGWGICALLAGFMAEAAVVLVSRRLFGGGGARVGQRRLLGGAVSSGSRARVGASKSRGATGGR